MGTVATSTSPSDGAAFAVIDSSAHALVTRLTATDPGTPIVFTQTVSVAVATSLDVTPAGRAEETLNLRYVLWVVPTMLSTWLLPKCPAGEVVAV
jgi:hypothetical protein